MKNLVKSSLEKDPIYYPWQRFIACVRSQKSVERLETEFSASGADVCVSAGDNIKALQCCHVALLVVDPADVESTLGQSGVPEAKAIISVVAGWTRQQTKALLRRTALSNTTSVVLRALPNVAASFAKSMTTIEVTEPPPRDGDLWLVDSMFERMGRTPHVPPRLLHTSIAVAGSTPAFFSVICDSLIDAAVAVGIPRDMA